MRVLVCLSSIPMLAVASACADKPSMDTAPGGGDSGGSGGTAELDCASQEGVRFVSADGTIQDRTQEFAAVQGHRPRLRSIRTVSWKCAEAPGTCCSMCGRPTSFCVGMPGSPSPSFLAGVQVRSSRSGRQVLDSWRRTSSSRVQSRASGRSSRLQTWRFRATRKHFRCKRTSPSGGVGWLGMHSISAVAWSGSRVGS